jgi:hypothetical protein
MALACLAALLLLAAGAPAQAQRTALQARAGITTSSPLVRDLVASAQVRQLLGRNVDEEVTLHAAPGPTLGAGVIVPLRRRMTLDAGLDVALTQLEARDGGGSRSLQDLLIVQGTAGVDLAVSQRIRAGAGLGVVHYATERAGLFVEGASLSPLVEARGGVVLPFWSERVTLGGAAQLHRFGTPAMRQAGGEDGMVTRYTVTARIRTLEFGR